MLFYIATSSEKIPPCPQAFITKAIFQNKFCISLKDAQGKEWFESQKQFCIDYYENDGILYIDFKPENIYVIELNSLEELCELRQELNYDITLGYSDYKDIPYSIIIQDHHDG